MPITPPNLDDRDYDDLYREVRARIPVHTPEWTNLNDSDPGVTLLQLFTHLVDNLSYRSNRIPAATRQKFLTLLGMGLQPATPGRGLVSFSTEGGAVTVPGGTVVRAGKVEFRTRRTVEALPVDAHVFWKRPRAELDADTLEHLQRLHDPILGEQGAARLAFYDPVELDAPTAGVPLPRIDLADPASGPVDGSVWVALTCSDKAVKAAGNDPALAVARLRPLLAGATLSLGILPADTEQGAALPPQRTVSGPVDPGLVVEAPAAGSAPTYQRLVLTYAENVLDEAGVIDVRLPALDLFVPPWESDPTDEGTGDLPPLVQDRKLAARIVTWLRVRRRSPGAAAVRPGGATVAWVGVNVARVTQAVRVERERVGTGTGAPEQQVRLAHAPVLVGDDGDPPAIEVQGPTGAWERWRAIDDLLAAGPADQVYSLDAESGVVTFGSGLHGARPALRAAITATYEHGGGPRGLVAIDAIKVVDEPQGVKVRNPLATWGASAGESVADGERSIPAWLRHRDRAVTAADFRDIVLRTPGVDLGRVDVLPLFDPRPMAASGDPTDAAGMVTVMVVPRADALAPTPPDATDQHVLDAVCRWLEPRRLITTEVHVRGARWVPVVVSIGVALMPGEVREEVEQRVRRAITEYLSALTGGLRAADDGISVEATGSSPSGWPLGSAVRADDLGAAATRVPGVRYVEGVRLASRRDGVLTSDQASITMSGLELPHATVFVTAGAPEDPLDLLGGSQPAADVVPVPVIPRSC